MVMENSLKNILCFGDSNTFGFNPATGGRFPRNIRWTGILQTVLGDGYSIIEDGLNGRTTVFDDPIRLYRAGKDDLVLTIDVNRPLDLIIISLGANDLKTFYNQPAANIALGIEYLLGQIFNYRWGGAYTCPKVLVVSPPALTDAAYLNNPFSGFNKDSVKKSHELAHYMGEICQKWNVGFLNGSKITEPGPDGVHLSPEGHKLMAEAIARYIKQNQI